MELVLVASNTAVQLRPLVSVFHSPPVAVATYMVSGLLSTTAMLTTRPPLPAGPIERALSSLSSAASPTLPSPKLGEGRVGGAASAEDTNRLNRRNAARNTPFENGRM